MPADLTVVSVQPPVPLRAPCTVVILVSIQNIGNDPADPVPYDVTIDLGAGGDAPSACFEALVMAPEDQRLFPGRTIVVPVNARFPCSSPVILRATVDKKQQVLNNLRSAPSQTLTALAPTPVPWLAATLRVGIRDSTGMVTFDPDVFCPGKAVVAEVVVENRGCATSKSSTTDVTLEDANAVPVPVRLTSQKYLVPPLAPGKSHTALLAFSTPQSATGTSGTLAVRVSADVDVANPDQCDRTHLVVRNAKPFSRGGAPQLTLTVGGGGLIRPGEVPSLSWSVVNECSEIGTADVTILFGTPPTQLHTTQLTIPLRSRVGRDLAPSDLTIPASVASAFWTVGLKSLELEVTGSGLNGGPYRTSTPLNVIPEPIDDTWWTWLMGAPTAFWKRSYTVDGTFNNLGLATMTVTALSAVEHPTDVTGSGQDQTVTPSRGIAGIAVAPGGSAAAAWLRRQGWPWLAQGTFVEIGPRSRTFSYVANYSVTDLFGNTYPMILSSATAQVVRIPSTKMAKHREGSTLVGIGLGALAAAALVGQAGGYAWIAAAVLAAFGMSLIIAGTLLLYDAFDPPVPDFRERPAALADPRAWTIPDVDDEGLHALHTVASLVARVASAQVQAVRYRDLAWAAYLDRSESTRVQHRDNARDQLETLRRLVPACLDAADEAHDQFEELLNAHETMPTTELLLEMTGRFAEELHLSDEERSLINERLMTVDDEELRRSIERARSDGLRTASDIMRTLYEATASEFAEREYLR